MEKSKKSGTELISADKLSLSLSTETTTREEFYNNLTVDNDRFSSIQLTEEEANKVDKYYRRYSTGLSAAVPLTCHKSCPFTDSCPYFAANKAPYGEPCKVEYDIINFYTRQFMEEFDVTPDNFSEVTLVGELAELLVYEIRATKTLAKTENADLTQTVTVLTAAGDEVDEDRVHNAWVIKERIKTRRLKILEALAATRKEKIKAIKNIDGDRAAQSIGRSLSDLRDKLESIVDTGREAAVDAVYSEVK